MIENLAVLPDQVIAALDLCGLSDYAIAKKLQIDKSTVGKWRAGINKPTPQIWGLFLLATNQHPHFVVKAH